MAKHFAEGKPIPIFYYGQQYMGNLEPICLAGLFKLFGLKLWLLRVVPLIFYVIGSFFLLHILRKENKEQHLLAPAILLIFPCYFLFLWSVKARGGFIEVVALSTLALYVRDLYFARQKTGWLFLLTILAGFSIYVNSLSLPFFLLLGIITLIDVRLQPTISNLTLAGLGGIIGLLPIIIHKLNPENVYGIMLTGGIPFQERTSLLFKNIFPTSLGIHVSDFTTPIGVIGIIYSLFLLSTMIFSLWHYRQSIHYLVRFKEAQYSSIFFLVLLLPAYLCALWLSPYLEQENSIRYLIYFILPLPAALSVFTSQLPNQKLKLISYVFLFVAGFLLSTIPGKRTFEITSTNEEIEELNQVIAYLNVNNLKFGYAGYWQQWEINYLTKESIITTSSHERYPAYRRWVEKESSTFFVTKDSIHQKDVQLFANFKAEKDLIEKKIGPYIIYTKQ